MIGDHLVPGPMHPDPERSTTAPNKRRAGSAGRVGAVRAHRRALALGALYSAGSRDLAPGDPMRWVANGA
jgi:hypothetical protein